MRSIAIISSVRETLIPGYNNEATKGADQMTSQLQLEVNTVFDEVRLIQGHTTKAKILSALYDASQNLMPGGLCVFYFQGHGDDRPQQFDRENEPEDQVLVCYDGYLFDDEIDHMLRNFHPTHRVFSIVDSCSSETVVEWKYEGQEHYPQVIHLAAAADYTAAPSTALGGMMSSVILNLIYQGGYSNYSYSSFCKRIQALTNNRARVRTTANIQPSFLNKQLFT